VRQEAEDGPAWLSPFSARTVFLEAIRRTREGGQLAAIDSVIDRRGYQRRLRERIAGWISSERPVRELARDAEPVEAAEWAVFLAYRTVLGELNCDDDAGMAVWASRRLCRSPRFWADPATAGPIVFLDLEHAWPVHWRVVERSLATERAVHVSVTRLANPAQSEVDLAVSSLRVRLTERGLEEEVVETAGERPAGLQAVEAALFQDPGARPSRIADSAGITIRGAPEGDGGSRVLAREVRALLDRGVEPDQVLIVFRHWSAEAELALETLGSWGIAAHADVPRPLEVEPAVSALRLAISIPLEEWETELIIRLLRHGQVRPVWPGSSRLELASTAAVIKATAVFRGREQLLRGLDRLQTSDRESAQGRAAARQARDLVDRLFGVLAPLDQPRPWADQATELRRVAEALGLGQPTDSVFDPLWEGLEDQADILDQLGRGEEPWSWSEFTAEIDAIVAEASVPPSATAPGSVRVATVDQTAGARAQYVILAGLAEGKFPAREAVLPLLTLGPRDEPDEHSRMNFAREMLRFLRVLGSADEGVILAYPTTDLKGQELLRAGFLDDVLALLSSAAMAACEVAHPRLHPALIDQPDLAGSPADLRVRATALAAEEGQREELIRLARHPGHRRVLDGAAAALFAQRLRLRGTPFGEFDGLLVDRAAALELSRLFDPQYAFSPSQLETYIGCPFQFYCKYVLALEPDDEKDELDEDYTERGSQLHDILESFERVLKQQSGEPDLDQITEMQVDALGRQDRSAATDLDEGKWQIQRLRLIETIKVYRRQREAYERAGGMRFRPHELELSFGEGDPKFPVIELPGPAGALRLRGRIDRIDVAETSEGSMFRVIDYKSGSVPSTTEVRQCTMLQLPLYAMAVQRLLFEHKAATLFDLGYWSLREQGFKPIVFENWDDDQQSLVAHALALIDDIRRGVFVVHSRDAGCESYCQFRGVCRVRQVRQAEKEYERPLPSLSVPTRRGRRPGAGTGAGDAAGSGPDS
jgi:RecB family exonuclease